jgi:hypothetical protein
MEWLTPEPNRRSHGYNLCMSKFSGTVRRSDLEGGHWQLESDDGNTYVLEGATRPIEQDGAKVEVDGAVDEDAMGIAMTGPILRVKTARRV